MHLNFRQIQRFRNFEDPAGDRAQFTFRPKLHFHFGDATRRTSASFPYTAHWLENAVPILTFRKRAGEAPWPVPIVCIGCPLPQLGVPHKTQWLASQMASQEFQNSVVMPR